MAKIDEIDRPTDAAFLLFYLSGEIRGITKIQKLLFLIEKETRFGERYDDKITFDFKAYKMGPFSPKVYEEVELLLNIGALEKVEGEESASDSFEINQYTDNEEGSEGLSGKTFRITQKGQKIGKQLEGLLDDDEIKELRALVEEYNEMPLMQLLEYVYTSYPKMTSKSEIKEDVLG